MKEAKEAAKAAGEAPDKSAGVKASLAEMNGAQKLHSTHHSHACTHQHQDQQPP